MSEYDRVMESWEAMSLPGVSIVRSYVAALEAALAERDKMLRLSCQDRKRIWEREMRHNGLWDQYEHPLDGESIDYWLADLARRVEGGE